MHIEIAQAVEFLGRLLQSKVDQDVIARFKEKLTELLKARFEDHWDQQQPYRGNGFRALSNFNGQLDPMLTQGRKKYIRNDSSRLKQL
jgi:protein Tob/BTG